MNRGPSRLSVAIAALAGVVFVAGCAGDDTLQGEGPVTVHVSLPLRGPSGADGQDAVDGARMALAEAGGEAGGREVRAVVLDDTEGGRTEAHWTPEQAAANARRAIEDSTTIAYIGDFESGATRGSLPITNEARLLQVSPASAAVDLVAPFPGSDDVPDVQFSGERTFGRVIPSDHAQGQAAAVWAGDLAWRRVRIESDGSSFADSLSDGFRAGAEASGIDTSAERGTTVYLAGRPPVVGAEAIGSDVFLNAARAPDLITSAALDPVHLPPAGQEFVDRFRARYGRQPGRYGAYGYEAMAVVLDSIERAGDAGTDREAVIDAFFDTEDRDSVLGTYSIDEVGDTTLRRLTGYRSDGGGAEPIAELTLP
ncbi:MAG TPA: branched-chain amino acid ABC transporter substrate-binding protein [Solirubrobacterales bacterium]|nr:branched-chain amino acid ABC transporter substrate-binding protein [Solirubrobacterales bacterium]